MDFIKLAIAFIGYCVVGPFAGIAIRAYPRVIDLVAFGLVFLSGLHIDTTIIVSARSSGIAALQRAMSSR